MEYKLIRNKYSTCCYERIGTKQKDIGFYCSKCNKEVFNSISKGATVLKFEAKYNLHRVNIIEKDVYDYRFWVFDFNIIQKVLRENWDFEQLINYKDE